MGTWGYNNFESDRAMDVLGTLMNQIVNANKSYLTKKHNDDLYQRYELDIVANVDILVTLCKHYGTFPNLSLEEAKRWRHDFLTNYDIFYDYQPNSSDEFTKNRRHVIEATFDELVKIVEELWSDE